MSVPIPQSASASRHPSVRRTWRRLIALGSIAIVVVCVLFTALLPALLSTSLGRGLVEHLLAGSVQGEVSIAELSLSWSGPQVVQGLSISGPDGAQVTLDIRADDALLPLASGDHGAHITLGGALSTTVRADGSLSIVELFVPRPTAPTRDRSERATSVSATSSAMQRESLAVTLRGLVVDFAGVTITATNVATGRVDALEALKGRCSVEASGVRAELSASTRLGDKVGSLSIRGVIGGLFATDGSIDFKATSADIQVQASELAVPMGSGAIDIPSLSLTIASPALERELSALGTMQIQIPTGEIARVALDVHAMSPLEPRASSYRGTISVDALAATALAPWLPAPFDASRDLGPNVSATISLDGRSGSINLISQGVQMQAQGALDETGRLLTLAALSVHARVDPLLMPSSARANSAATVTLTGRDLTFPLMTPSDVAGWKQVRGDLALDLSPIDLVLERSNGAEPSPPIAIGATTVKISSSDFSSSLSLAATTSVGGVPMSIDEVIAGLVGPTGLTLDAATATGSINVDSTTLATAKWLPDQTRQTLAQCGVTTLAGRVETRASLSNGSARVAAQLGANGVAIDLSWDEKTIHIEPVTLSVTATPELVARWAPDSVALGGAAPITVRTDAVTLSREEVSAGRVVPEQLTLTITSPLVEIARAPGLTRGARLRDCSLTALCMAPSRTTFNGVRSTLKAALFDQDSAAGSVVASFAMNSFAVSAWESTIDLTVAEGPTLVQMVDAHDAEGMLVGPGRIAAAFSRASTGVGTATTDSFSAKVSLPRITLTTSGTLAEGAIDLGKSSATVDLPAAVVGGAQGASLIATIDVESLRWTGKAADASVVMSAVIEPGTLTLPGRDPLSFEKVSVSVRSPRLAERAVATFDGAFAVGSSPAGPLSLALDAQGDLSLLMGSADRPLTLHESQVKVQAPGALTLALIDWMKGSKDATSALARIGAVGASVAIKSLVLPPSGFTQAALDATVTLDPIEIEPAGKPALSLGTTRLTATSPRVGESIDISLTGGGPKGGTFELTAAAKQLTTAAGIFAPSAAQWVANAQVRALSTALVDALAGQGGQLVEALGSTIDATLDATVAASATGVTQTNCVGTIKTQFLEIAAPRVTLFGQKALVDPANPVRCTFTVNPVLQKRLLEPVNPVLADIRSAPPIVLTLSQASYPLDGALAGLDLDARVEVGEVEIVRSNQILGVLVLAQQAKSQTIPAHIHPLVLRVRSGRLTYDDFVIQAGKLGTQWQQTLKLSGDINLATTPPFANAIRCRYPLASLARTVGGASGSFSATMTQLSDAIAELPIDPGELVQADITLSGPLGAVNGVQKPLTSKVSLAFDASSLDAKHIEKGIKDIGGTIDKIKGLFGK